MRVAIPVWQGKVSPVLDTALTLRIVDCDEKVRLYYHDARIPEQELSMRCIRIRGLNIDVVICGAVSTAMSEMLKASGIQVIFGISGCYEKVLDAYLNNCLFCQEFMMPGYDHGKSR